MKPMRLFNSIAQRFVGLLLLTSVVPLCVVGTLSYRVTYQVLREEATNSQEQLVTSQEDYLELQLRQISSLIFNISGEEQIIEAIDSQISHDSTYLELATQARIGYILNKYTSLDGLVSIDIYSESGRHFHVGDTLNVSALESGVKQRISQQLKQSNYQDIVWMGVEKNINKNSKIRQVVTIAKAITVTDLIDSATPTRRESGVLVVNYDLNYFHEHFSKVDFGETGYLVIVDAQGRIIYHRDKTKFGAQVNRDFLESLQQQDGAFVSTVNGENMLISHQQSAISGWTIVSFMPIRELLVGARLIRSVTLAATAAALTVVAFAALKFSRELVGPIQRVTHHFRMLQSGNLSSVDYLPTDQTNEIGELNRGFNALLDSLLVKQQMESALRESEQRYSLALQGSNDGIWDWDLTAHVIHFSPRWQDMVGYPDHISPNNLDDWLKQIYTDDVSLVVCMLTEHLQGNMPHFEVEHRLLKYGREDFIWVLVRGMVTRDASGRATRMAGSMTDITSRKAAEAKLRHDALHDVLTGLPNRKYFNQRLAEVLVNASKDSSGGSAIILLDLDRFKLINDSLGHAAGDTLLVQTSERLKGCMRQEDFSARLGGDEFAIILVNVPAGDWIENFATRIQHELSQPICLEGHEVSVSASLGIAPITDPDSTAAEILRNADTALYYVKEHGRAKFAIFDRAMYDQTVALLQAESSLQQALHNEEFSLHYQPIFSLTQNQIVAVEALIRWHSPELGVVSPGEFIPRAEELGMIATIGKWVIGEACRQGQRWQTQGYSQLKLSVNVSAQQLKDVSLPQFVADTLRHTQFPASQLQLEITESTAMADVDLTCKVLSQIQALGVSIAIDDFGLNYSSLGYLRQLPIDGIKIDRSFIQDVPGNVDAVAITSAIIAMARILNLTVTAEGVETPEQLEFLTSQSCDNVQGYLFSPSLPADELAAVSFSGLKTERKPCTI